MSFLEAVLSFVSSGAPETSTLCSEPRTRSRTHVYPKYRKTIAHGMFLHTTNRSQNGTQIREFATLFASIGLNFGKSGPLFTCAGPSRAHERQEFAREWLPFLGACPKATWMTSICEPTAYRASFPMNFAPCRAKFQQIWASFHMRRAIESP